MERETSIKKASFRTKRQFLFNTVYQPLLKEPPKDGVLKKTDKPLKWLEIPEGYILEDLEWMSRKKPGKYLSYPAFIEVRFITNDKSYIGWVRSAWVEPYFVKKQNIIKIKASTGLLSDAAQYLIHKGQVQYNLCGEFSVLYCAGWHEAFMEDWLEVWEGKEGITFKRIFKNGRSAVTGIPDIESMLKTFVGYKTPATTIQAALKDEYLGYMKTTPLHMARILHKNRIIIGCHIETAFGKLKPKGTRHWVVVESIEPEARGGLVHIYNSFSNTIEHYTWEEFLASVGIPYGILVPR